MSRYAQHISATSRHLIKDLRSARLRLLSGTDGEALHDLRVGIRRLRSTLLPLTSLPGMHATRRALKPLKKLADASNTVRDGEVQGALLREHPMPGGGQSLLNWQHGQQARYRHTRRKLNQRLERAPWKKWLKRLEKRLTEGLADCSKQDVNTQLTAAYQALLATLRGELADPGLFSDAEHWHHTRLNCKRLRYLLESHGERLAAGSQKQAKYAKAAQDSLGELRDWDVLGATLAADKVAVDPDWYAAEHAIRRRQADEDCTALAEVLAL